MFTTVVYISISCKLDSCFVILHDKQSHKSELNILIVIIHTYHKYTCRYLNRNNIQGKNLSLLWKISLFCVNNHDYSVFSPAIARDMMEEPTKYFLSKFPTLFMSVYKAIKASERREKVCYKPFF